MNQLARQVLALDKTNEDARQFLSAAERMQTGITASPQTESIRSTEAEPSSFAGGRYAVKKFLGEGGKKKVYLAHDSLLDRDVAFAQIKFAQIKIEGLDDVGRERVTREGQAMGRLGSHPHVVTVFDLGEMDGQPFMVTELMGGGDVEGLIEKAGGHLPLEQAISIALAVCRAHDGRHNQGTTSCLLR